MASSEAAGHVVHVEGYRPLGLAAAGLLAEAETPLRSLAPGPSAGLLRRKCLACALLSVASALLLAVCLAGTRRQSLPLAELLGLQAVGCHTALPGEPCYSDVLWAMKHGILEHPEWYPGLTVASSFEAFQGSPALRRYARCSVDPCQPGAQPPPTALGQPPAAQAGPCATAQFGTDCYSRIMWVMRKGIVEHPDWYGGLDSWSSFEDVQRALTRKGEVCQQEPCPAPRNTVARAPSLSTNPVCNSLVPGQALGLPDVWPLPASLQEKCFEEMQGQRQHGALEKESWLVAEDQRLMEGRNWCWVGFKEFGCHRTWSDHLTWAEMQSLALSSGVTMPLEFRPVQAPEVCDKRDNGAPTDWTPDELARASAWFGQYVSAYVLSLPGSSRRPRAQACLQGAGIPFAFVDGVDLRQPGALFRAQQEGLVPASFNFERAQAKAYSEGQNMGAAGSIMGTVGCAAAHFKAQRAELAKAPELRRPITLIFEDDVCPERDFVPRLWSMVTEELPCDWEAVSLYSRCPFGRCVSPRLTRVMPDANEPMWRCRHGVNWGFQGMLYRTETVETMQSIWQPIVFDEETPNCLYLDNALAAISDRINFYAVPAAQSPGFLREMDYSGSERIQMNHQAGGGNPWHTCTTSGCNRPYLPNEPCQCNDACQAHGDCCHDYEAHCKDLGPSLFCFALARPYGGEQALLQGQLQLGAGIFGCSGYSVFSSQGVTLYGPPNVVASVVDANLAVPTSPTFHTALNTAVFVEVWRKVFAESRFADYDWVVKADPDTVFIPGRLTEHLRPNQNGYPSGKADAVYVLNCGLGLHGPIEVLSQKAALVLKDGGLQRCLDDRVTDWSLSGEDDFASRCWPHVGVQRLIDFGVLDEARCGGIVSPCMSGKVAFHPFKDLGAWRTCLWQAQR